MIRLLEPCQAKCSFCICRSGQPIVSVSTTWRPTPRGPRARKRDRGVHRRRAHADQGAHAHRSGQGARVPTVGLQTNGIKLADRTYAEHRMQASTDSPVSPQPDPATHESIFKIDGCFDACVAGAQSAMALGSTDPQLRHHAAEHRPPRRLRRICAPNNRGGRSESLRQPSPLHHFQRDVAAGLGRSTINRSGRLTDIASVGRALDPPGRSVWTYGYPDSAAFRPVSCHATPSSSMRLFEERPVRIPTRTLFAGCDDCAYGRDAPAIGEATSISTVRKSSSPFHSPALSTSTLLAEIASILVTVFFEGG